MWVTDGQRFPFVSVNVCGWKWLPLCQWGDSSLLRFIVFYMQTFCLRVCVCGVPGLMKASRLPLSYFVLTCKVIAFVLLLKWCWIPVTWSSNIWKLWRFHVVSSSSLRMILIHTMKDWLFTDCWEKHMSRTFSVVLLFQLFMALFGFRCHVTALMRLTSYPHFIKMRAWNKHCGLFSLHSYPPFKIFHAQFVMMCLACCVHAKGFLHRAVWMWGCLAACSPSSPHHCAV